MHEYLAALIALVGNFLLSLGMVLQKKSVGWFGYKERKDRKYRRAKSGWIVGFTLMNLHPIFNYVALLGLPPNVVAAMIGTNVAFTSLLAALLLGEKINKRRITAFLLIFGAVALLGLRGKPHLGGLRDEWLYVFGAIPLGIGALCWIFRRRLLGPAFPTAIAAVSGSLGGYMVLAMKAFQLRAGGDTGLWFTTPYIYLYFLGGLGAFSLIQLAFKHGDVTLVSPADYGMQVLWPSLASYFIFGMTFDPLQVGCIAAIVVAILLIAGSGIQLPKRRRKAQGGRDEAGSLGGS
ncbi:MAG: DMT family transporter [Spirochaetaceae bacterium]|nr:DMT family transporter [Spirochaetaceae bacterium]